MEEIIYEKNKESILKRLWKYKTFKVISIFLGLLIFFFGSTYASYIIIGAYGSGSTPSGAPTYINSYLNSNNKSVRWTNESWDETANIDNQGNIYSKGNLTMNYSNGNGYGYFQFLGDSVNKIVGIFASRADIVTINSSTLNASTDIYVGGTAAKQYLYNQTATAYFYNMSTGINNGTYPWFYYLNVSGEIVTGLINISGAGGKIRMGGGIIPVWTSAKFSGTTQVNNQQTDDGAEVAYGLYVNDGGTNRRAKFFLNDSAGVWGLWSTQSNTEADFAIGSAANEYLRIKATTGNVGIGTTAPSHTLTVVGGANISQSSIIGNGVNSQNLTIWSEYQSSGFTADSALIFSSGARERIKLISDQISAATNDYDLRFQFVNSAGTGYNDWMYIDGSLGRVGINTTAPTHVLNVNGNMNVTTEIAVGLINISGTTGKVGIGTVSPAQLLEVKGNVNVTTGGNITIGGLFLYTDASGGHIKMT